MGCCDVVSGRKTEGYDRFKSALSAHIHACIPCVTWLVFVVWECGCAHRALYVCSVSYHMATQCMLPRAVNKKTSVSVRLADVLDRLTLLQQHKLHTGKSAACSKKASNMSTLVPISS
jgi:hypothetical protein